MARRRGWIAGMVVVGLLLTLPQVALWRPTPDTPLQQGLFWVAGLSYHVSGLLLGVALVAAAVLVGERAGLVRLTGGPAPRLVLLAMALVVLGTVAGWGVQRLALGVEGHGLVGWSLLLIQVFAWVVGLGYALAGVWLAGRLPAPHREHAPPAPVRDPSQPR
ncbi:hypothetical protein [Serinicoccus sp. CUA-874]|uniref:hypothetical protein n=1 Tax=Serinicoccus sp. CUA-874 TaxID=1517939 RepID=UPI001179E46B|nr:hypothetical protein [Serinicoccus sp. CUA-874]